MPRITAPTVVEHRLRQRELLLRAATDLLIADGVAAVTPGAVGAAAGLSRPSVYQYFSSGAEILAAVIEDSFPPANASLAAALDGISDPLARLETYVRHSLQLAAEGGHRVAAAFSGAPLPEACRARITELHHEQAAPFVAALAEVGAPELPITAQLLGGTIESAMRAVEAGAPVQVVTERTLVVVRAAVDR